MGEIMISACMKLGIAGVDHRRFGARYRSDPRSAAFPTYAAGANPNGPTKLVPGRVNWPVSVGGAAVHPGDLIVADADGVVVIERSKVESVLALAAQKVADETVRLKEIRGGGQLRPGWLAGALSKAGVVIEGGHAQ